LDFHVSFQEKETAAKVAAELRSYGIEEVFEGVGKVSVCPFVLKHVVYNWML
jgi:metal-dependent amidase/aminoacylase/carboxypeptidase family protein